MDRDAVAVVLEQLGEPRYRMDQIVRAQRAGAGSWDEVTTLGKQLRAELAGHAPLWSAVPEERLVSVDGTVKWRLGLADGEAIPEALRAFFAARRRSTSPRKFRLIVVRFCKGAYLLLMLSKPSFIPAHQGDY